MRTLTCEIIIAREPDGGSHEVTICEVTSKFSTNHGNRMTNFASNCVLEITQDESGDDQSNMPILLSLLHVTKALNQELWSGVPFRLTAESLWSSLEANLQNSGMSTTF
ncbi:hypothetical protein TNCV_2810931 [Trichonephila clavipes]|nr:hypothetical protein TNCV_2810931 [Trichonephila clavipes]